MIDTTQQPVLNKRVGGWKRLKTISFMMLALAFSCSSTSKEEAVTGEAEASAATWTVTISGKVNNPTKGQISIMELRENSTGPADTIKLKYDNTFRKKVTLSQPSYYRINFYNMQMVDVILYKNDLTVNADGNNSQGFFEVKGSPDLEIIRQVQSMSENFNSSPEVNQLNTDYAKAGAQKDQAKLDQLYAQYQSLLKKNREKIGALLVEKSPSLAVINLLQSNVIDKDQQFSTFEAVAAKLKAGEWANYSHAKSFVDQVNTMRVLAIGQPAPEISLPDPDGKVIPLSSLRGKYVLVDFWAKWCGPCRAENPNVVRAYNKYKDKGFTVYGVSLDRSKEDWLQAIKADNLTWTHVSDLKYWQSEAARTYNITGIPFSVLLDPNGIIIAKNLELRGPALHSKLEEIFSKKN